MQVRISKADRFQMERVANLIIQQKMEGLVPDYSIIRKENSTSIDDEKFEEYVTKRVMEKELNPEYYMLTKEFTSIKRFIFEDETIYEFTLKNGKSFKLSSIDLMHKFKFDASFMNCTGKIPLGKRQDYCVFLTHAFTAKEVIQSEITKEADEITDVKEAIFRFIEGATIVSHPDDTQFAMDSIYEQGGSLYVPSSAIKRIIKREDKNFTMRHLRVVLNPFLKSSSTVVRLKDKSCRFWVFDMAKLNLPLKIKKVNLDKEEEDGKN